MVLTRCQRGATRTVRAEFHRHLPAPAMAQVWPAWCGPASCGAGDGVAPLLAAARLTCGHVACFFRCVGPSFGAFCGSRRKTCPDPTETTPRARFHAESPVPRRKPGSARKPGSTPKARFTPKAGVPHREAGVLHLQASTAPKWATVPKETRRHPHSDNKRGSYDSASRRLPTSGSISRRAAEVRGRPATPPLAASFSLA